MRYFGESNPLLFLQECRKIFSKIQGPTHFVTDPKINYVYDEPKTLMFLQTVPLPTEKLLRQLVKLFQDNVNDVYYVMDKNYLKEQILDIYRNKRYSLSQEKLCLLYLIVALGLSFAEMSQEIILEELKDVDACAFFDSALLIQRGIDQDSSLWQVEFNFLLHFYYVVHTNRTLSWIHLGHAIRYAQSIGVHRKDVNEIFEDESYSIHRRRLWVSLFICDRILLIGMGRPLGINLYDWEDLGSIFYPNDPNENFKVKCQRHIADVCAINGRILEHLYQNKTIALGKANELAVELKNWSLNLPSDLSLRTLLDLLEDPEKNEIPYLLVLLHLFQFYGIVMLCKPFFVLALMRKLDMGEVGRVANEQLVTNFCRAAIRASFLTVELISKFVRKTERLEMFATTNCCFFASLVLAFTLFVCKRSGEEDASFQAALELAARKGQKILFDYGTFNIISSRWSDNVSNMLQAIEDDKASVPANGSLTFQDILLNLNDDIVTLNTSRLDAMDEMMAFLTHFVPLVTEEDPEESNIDNPSFLDIFMQPVPRQPFHNDDSPSDDLESLIRSQSEVINATY